MTERRSGDVLHSGTVTNRGATPLLVTVTIGAAVDAGIPDKLINGFEVSLNGWARSGFNWTDSTRKAAAWTGTRQVASGDTVPTPQIRYLFADSSYGTSTLSVIVPAPATAVSPAPVPFLAFTAPVARTAPRSTSSEGQRSFDR